MSGDEQERLAALHEYRLLDAPADDELEAVVRVAAMVAGLLADVRFYASAPLVTPQGHALGSLCVFDSQPRELGADQIARLKDLARVILALFERRRQARVNARLLAEAEARQEFTDAVLETIDVAVVAADPSGHLSMFNRAGRAWHGLDADASVDPEELSERYQLFRTDGVTPLPADEIPLLCALRDGAVHGAEMIIRPVGGPPRHVVGSGRAMASPSGTPLGAVVAMADVTADRAQRLALERALAATIAELQRSNTELEQFAGVVSQAAAGAQVTVGADLPRLDVDPTLMRQLLQNLIGNAVKYRHPDRPARIAVAAVPRGDDWLVTVTDNGIGRIWAEAAPGGGTTIAFTLPGA